MDFTKTQKPNYPENETLFFIQIKKFIERNIKGYIMAKNIFVAEVTFKFCMLFSGGSRI